MKEAVLKGCVIVLICLAVIMLALAVYMTVGITSGAIPLHDEAWLVTFHFVFVGCMCAYASKRLLILARMNRRIE